MNTLLGRVSVLAFAAASLFAAPAAEAAQPCGTTGTYRAHYSHVVWIVMENHSSSQALSPGSYAAALASQCTEATNYSAITHPSLPNYIAMTSGSTQGITDDAGPSSHQIGAPSIFSQTSAWRSLEESMPSACYRWDYGLYTARHNPAAYYTNLTNCWSNDIPLGAVPDISARFTFITPNLCNDAHDCSTSTGDTFLRSFIPKLVTRPEYKDGSTAVFITWDEDDSRSGNKVALIAMSTYAAPGHKTSTAFNHYSLLKTTEDTLSLPQLGGAVAARDMRTSLGL